MAGQVAPHEEYAIKEAADRGCDLTTRTARDRLLTKALDRLSELADPTDVTNLRVSMDKLLFWLGIGAAQKGAGSKPTASLHPVVAFVVGILLALLIAVGAFILLVSQQ
jgi:hypothetical protein